MKLNVKRLPDSEFEIMRVIWHSELPVTTGKIIENLGSDVSWKPQTVLTILVRLIEKGFLSSEKNGKERCYTPLVSESDYLEVETGNFLKRYSGNPMGNLVKTLFSENDFSDDELQELRDWLSERK